MKVYDELMHLLGQMAADTDVRIHTCMTKEEFLQCDQEEDVYSIFMKITDVDGAYIVGSINNYY